MHEIRPATLKDGVSIEDLAIAKHEAQGGARDRSIRGGALIFWPLGGMLSLTLVLAVFLAIDGTASIFYALAHRRHGSQRWSWVLVNGVLDLILAAVIVWWLPVSAVWVLGLILGIDLVFAGTALIAMALGARPAT